MVLPTDHASLFREYIDKANGYFAEFGDSRCSRELAVWAINYAWANGFPQPSLDDLYIYFPPPFFCWVCEAGPWYESEAFGYECECIRWS